MSAVGYCLEDNDRCQTILPKIRVISSFELIMKDKVLMMRWLFVADVTIMFMSGGNTSKLLSHTRTYNPLSIRQYYMQAQKAKT